MKKSIKYILFIVVFIVFVVSITISTLFTKYSDQGKFIVSRKNFNIVFSNIIVNNDNVKVKVDNNTKSIHIEVLELDSEEISIDIKNIANIDGIIKNYSITNVDTNVNNKEDIDINVSLPNDVIIKSGESKKLNINIKNNTKSKEIYYKFNINYLIEEYNL